MLKRGSPYPSFVNFDATARLACTVKRSRTNTPLQALTLLNDPVYVEAAKALAKRVTSDLSKSTLDEQINFGFQICTGRPPTDSERKALRGLYDATLAAEMAAEKKLDREAARANAWYNVATVLLNLHETITKD